MAAIGFVSADGSTVIPASVANPLPVDATLTLDPIVTALPTTNGPFTDRSATLVTGGTHQQLMGPNATRKYLYIANDDPSDLGDIYINFGATAVIGAKESIRLRPGDRGEWSMGLIPDTYIDWVATTSGKKITAKEG